MLLGSTNITRHKQKTVDLTGPFRTSGLSPGAKLELVQKSKSASVVSIALDVNGQRYTKKLPSDMSLWKVMRQFETTEKGLNLTGRSIPVGTNNGQLYHEGPVVNIMGREYSAMEDLQKTMSQCGINSGSIVLRLTFKLGDRTLHDAIQEIAQYLDEVEPEKPKTGEEVAPHAAPAIEQATADDVVMGENTTPETQEPIRNEDQVVSPASTQPGATSDEMIADGPAPTPTSTDPLQPTNVFNAPASSTPVAAHTREDDSVYEPTIAHAQLRQQQLLHRSQNTRLKSDAELAAEAAAAAAQIAKITSVEVKVRFPDQTSAVWNITPEETGAFLYQAIRNVMANPTAPFKLVLPGPKTIIQESEKKLIAGYKLKGREMLHLLWDDSVAANTRKEVFLKGSVASRAKEVVVPKIPQGRADEEEKGAASGAAAGPSNQQTKRDGGSARDSEAVKKKLSKFLGLKKK